MRTRTLTLLLCLLAACTAPTTPPPSITPPTATVQPPLATAPLTLIAPTPTESATRNTPPTATRPPSPATPLAGTWLTNLPFPADAFHNPHVLLTLRDDSGTFAVPLNTTTLPLDNLIATDSTVSFDVNLPDGAVHYDLTLAGDGELEGAASRSDQSTPVTFLRLASLTPGEFARFIGWYAVTPEELIYVYQEGQAFMYRDYLTSRVGQLLPTSENTFVTGPARFVAYPPNAYLTFEAAGTLTLSIPNQPALTAHRLATFFTTEEVTFANGSVTLAGTLVKPTLPSRPAGARYPAVVMLHGSNPQRRGDLYYRMRAEWLAYYGIATLLYDKRGVGDSTGVYVERATNANLDHLAGDGLAGVELLRAHPAIDPNQIGVMGDSQAGWIAPRMAARDPRLAFSVMLVGPTVSPAQEDLFESLIGPVDLGFSDLTEEQITQRVLAANGAGEFDPLEYLRAMTLPAYWLYGGLDRSIPTAASAAVLDDLIAAGHPNHTYTVFPGANHSLYISANPEATARDLEDLAYLPGLHPAVYDSIRAWLLSTVALP